MEWVRAPEVAVMVTVLVSTLRTEPQLVRAIAAVRVRSERSMSLVNFLFAWRKIAAKGRSRRERRSGAVGLSLPSRWSEAWMGEATLSPRSVVD